MEVEMLFDCPADISLRKLPLYYIGPLLENHVNVEIMDLPLLGETKKASF